MANNRQLPYVLRYGYVPAWFVFSFGNLALAAPEAADVDAEIDAPSGNAPAHNGEATQAARAVAGAAAVPVTPATNARGEASITPVASAGSTATTQPPSRHSLAGEGKPQVETNASKSEGSYELSGYVQSELQFHQDSEDQLRQGGAVLNQNRFLIRRGRLRIARDWDYASAVVEFDGNTAKGASARLQKAEASAVYRRSTTKGNPPLLQLSAGLFDLPFGFEMTDSAKTRAFMERSIVSRALFPGEPDVGIRLTGAAAFLRYSVTVSNGEPLEEKSGYGLQDPNANKDVTVRLGMDTKTSERFRISGGISYNAGKGFHAGTDATKSTISATDSNGDGVPENITMNAGQAATPSENFSRWAVGGDLQLRVKTWLGESMLYGEVVAAQNLDRGLIVADPTIGKQVKVREFGGYIGFTQALTKYFVCGVRGDYYDPNADFFDDRAGKQLPTSLRVLGLSPMAGVVLPERGRLLLQWDIQDNKFARDGRGVPTRLKNNAVTLRLQVNL